MTIQEKKEALQKEMVGLEAIDEILKVLTREKQYNTMMWNSETETYEEYTENYWNFENMKIKSNLYDEIIKMIEKKYL